MLPIAILPVAGLLLGFGGSFTNETMLKTYHLIGLMGPGTVFHAIFQVMSEAGNTYLQIYQSYLQWVWQLVWRRKRKK